MAPPQTLLKPGNVTAKLNLRAQPSMLGTPPTRVILDLGGKPVLIEVSGGWEES